MGQFKPMVKMMTTEPSVILKLKKGGKVAKKADGGFMPMASSMPAGLPARGGMAPAASPMKPSLAARRRAMNPNLLMKKGGKAEKHEDAAQDRAMIKKALAGKKFASGGEIDSAETKTTVKGNAMKFAKTKVVDGDKFDSAKGTGKVKNGNGGGYATGGTIEGNVGKFAKTKVVDGDKFDSAKGTGGVKNGNGGGYKMGGTIKGGTDWENRPADTAKPGKSGGTTGGVRLSNAGGYKMGGKASKKAYATGGKVDSGKAVEMPRKPVSRPVANSLQSGTFAKGGKVEKEEKPNLRLLKTHTGPKGHVAKVYKDKDWGEHRVKFFSPEGKHHADSDYHTDDLSDAHDTAQSQLNRYKKGGTAKRYESGGSTLVDASKGQYDKAIGPSEEDMDMAKAIRSVPRKLYEGAKGMLGFGTTPKPAGSVTKTEKSVTVAPASKKRGGRC